MTQARKSVEEEAWPTVWTIGHSTRSLDEFNELLLSNRIGNIVDVRSYPASRKHPQFSQAKLSESLSAVGVNYYHLPRLGGRRKPLPDSRRTAWRNRSFQAYADYMDSSEFKEGIDELLALASENRTAIMCAEAVWWRCHRGLIADYLKSHGAEVIHIIDAGHIQPHPYTSAARIVEGRLSYEMSE
jgi:uncharacterized protein (DUF488 family)